jgi:Trk K+ transport system NAD-binding subunit
MLFGYKKGGSEYAKVFEKMKSSYIVIDYDPDVIDHIDQDHLPYLYGDAMDLEILEEAGVDKIKLAVITLSDHATNSFLVQSISTMNPRAVIVSQADNPKIALELYALGATYVVLPHYIGSEKISNFIRKNGFSKAEFKKFKEESLVNLKAMAKLYE